MPTYEHVFLARQDVTSQQVEAMVEQFKGVIEAGGGSIDKAIAEMERQMRINEDVIRFMTLKIDEIDETPSVMMLKRDRDERKDRERRRREEEGYGFGGNAEGGSFGEGA